jgi:hypothetical protein
MNSDKLTVAVLEDFIKKVRLASKNNQKEIKISIAEAENIVHNLTILTLKLLDKPDSTTQSVPISSIIMDGGNL